MAAASRVSALIAESAAIIRTTAKGIWVQTCATMTANSAMRGSVSQPIGLLMRPSSVITPLRNPKLGWKTQTHSTAEMAPGRTQGNSTTDLTTLDPKKRRCRKSAIRVPRTTTAGAANKVNTRELRKATGK